MCTKISFFITLLFTLFLQIFGQIGPLIYVNTTRGQLVGYQVNNDANGTADVFLGIPFAIPPVGPLRYKYPRPITQYPGTSPYNATYYRKQCVQPNQELTNMSEDCLYFHVYTPNSATTTKYPVLVWIHGGSLITGSGHFGVNGGVIRSLVSKGITMASIDYRMGWLDLFQQVIMESGTVLTCYEDSVGPTKRNFQFAEYACNYTEQMWDSRNFGPLKDCLMKIDIASGLAATEKIRVSNGVCWNMVQDNYFIPKNPQQLGPKRPNIPAIIGNCKDEQAYHILQYANVTHFTRHNVESGILSSFTPWFGNGTKAQEVLQIFEENYLPPGVEDDDNIAWLQFQVDVYTARDFTWGSLRDIEYYLENNNPNVYVYLFSWSSNLNDANNSLPNWHPAPHVCELPYLFGFSNNWNQTDQDLALSIQSKWANFVINGKPTTDNSWKPTTSKNYTALEYYEFYNVSAQKVGFRNKDQIVWNQAIPPVLGVYPPDLPDTNPFCPRGYQSKIKNTTCYEVFGTPLSWSDAQNYCAQNSYGALVSVGSAFENSDLLAYAKKTSPSCSGFYTGLFKSIYTPDWTWNNYDPSTYRNWKNGAPSQDASANCVVLDANDGTWSNQACATTQCYVCSY